ncbi:MAG: hypothetical protein GXO43_05795 [Crenarchaeota archaeon]|nr:hypothetical protein [Thermoproteota archaeon]
MSMLAELRKALEKLMSTRQTVTNTGETVRVTGYTPSGSLSNQDLASSINTLAEKIAGQLAKLYENPDLNGFNNLEQWLSSLRSRNPYQYELLIKTVSHLVSGKPYYTVWETLITTGDPHQAYNVAKGIKERLKKMESVKKLEKILPPQEIKMVVNSKGEVDPEKLAELIKKRIESMLYRHKGMINEQSLMQGLEEVRKLIHIGVSMAGDRKEAWKTIIEKVGGREAGAGKLQLILKRVAMGDMKTALKMITSMSHGKPTAVSAKQSSQELHMAVHGGKKEENSSGESSNFRSHVAERIVNMAKNIEKPPMVKKPISMA